MKLTNIHILKLVVICLKLLLPVDHTIVSYTHTSNFLSFLYFRSLLFPLLRLEVCQYMTSMKCKLILSFCTDLDHLILYRKNFTNKIDYAMKRVSHKARTSTLIQQRPLIAVVYAIK